MAEAGDYAAFLEGAEDQKLAERRAYARGYNAGLKGYWPQWCPPLPPEENIKRMMEAAKGLRDAVDTELAMLCEDDQWQTKLGDPMDVVTESLETVRAWLTCREAKDR